MLIICGLSILYNWKCYKNILNYNLRKIKLLPWFAIFILLLVLAQALLSSYYQHEDADDAFYVASATTAVATDSIFQYDPYTGIYLDIYPVRYALSPLPIYISVLSKLILIHPAIVAHTILPAVLIPFSYIILALLGKRLFSDRSSAVLLFLMFICFLNIFGNISVYTNSTFLLFRIWQGKAMLANIILPAILYYSLRTMPEKTNIGNWVMLFACALAACLVSSMGIILAPIMIVCLGFLFACNKRDIHTLIYSLVCCTPCIICGVISVIKYIK